jgi:hypothetical protein
MGKMFFDQMTYPMLYAGALSPEALKKLDDDTIPLDIDDVGSFGFIEPEFDGVLDDEGARDTRGIY